MCIRSHDESNAFFYFSSIEQCLWHDVDEEEDELIELKLLQPEESNEQPIEVSDGENESNPPKIIKNLIKPH